MHHPGVSYGSAEETDIHQIGDRQEDGARTVESLTPKKCCSKGSYCRRAYHGYFFKSKALALVLILNALFSTAIYGVASEVLTIIIGPQYVLTRNVVLHGLTQILFPIAGHIADTYVGKHKAIRFSFWLAWLGFAVLSISFSLDPFDDHINRANRYAILPITFTLLSIAYVIFMATIIPFGIDQLQGASHVHYRSFFYWWYWTLNIGVALVNYPQYCGKRVELKFIIQALVGLVCVSAALIIDVLLRHWFVIEPKSTKNNPLKQIARILRYVAKASPDRQRIPSTVRHELDMDHFGRLDLAKKRYGGQYETEEVEDVRTFFRILILLFAIGFAVLSYATVSHVASYTTVSYLASIS